jgi:prevent-host-death family protein
MNHTTSVARLKASLSEVLARVKAGQEVIVTERGRPVARLQAYETEEAVLDALVRAGLVRLPARRLPAGFWARKRPADKAAAVVAALLAEREEGR